MDPWVKNSKGFTTRIRMVGRLSGGQSEICRKKQLDSQFFVGSVKSGFILVASDSPQILGKS